MSLLEGVKQPSQQQVQLDFVELMSLGSNC